MYFNKRWFILKKFEFLDAVVDLQKDLSAKRRLVVSTIFQKAKSHKNLLLK